MKYSSKEKFWGNYRVQNAILGLFVVVVLWVIAVLIWGYNKLQECGAI